MKYVVFAARIDPDPTVQLMPVIFPKELAHADVARALCYNMARGTPRVMLEPVSAGFVNSGSFGSVRAHGESETLGLASVPDRDSALITGCDYGSGFTPADGGSK